MRFNILCVVFLVVVCMVMVESTSSKSKLKRFLIKVNSWKKSSSKSQPLQNVLSHLRNKVSLIFTHKHSSSNSNSSPGSDPDSTEDCDDVSDAIEELYKNLCTVSCDGKDYYCNMVIYRYIKPLCVYKNALEASKAIIVKIGCKQMRYRKQLICKTTSKKACELAEEVADFCDAADASDGDCGKHTTQITNAATSTTTESVTTLNPGPLASDNRCDTFTGKCYLGNCPSTLSELDICETSGYICCV